MNPFLLAAAILIFLIGLLHSLLGERLVFRHLRVSGLVPTRGDSHLREFRVRILWATWHVAKGDERQASRLVGLSCGRVSGGSGLMEGSDMRVLELKIQPPIVGYLSITIAGVAAFRRAKTTLKPPAFVVYIGRFQIALEERVLSPLFGDGYEAYKKEVRRWI